MQESRKLRHKKDKKINYMTFWKRQNYGDNKNISGCQALGAQTSKAQGTFRTVKLLWMIL